MAGQALENQERLKPNKPNCLLRCAPHYEAFVCCVFQQVLIDALPLFSRNFSLGGEFCYEILSFPWAKIFC